MSSSVHDLTPAEVNRMLSEDTILLVDVREPGEYAVDHIAGAVLLPLSAFDPALLPEAAGRQIVFQCGIGKRSAMAAEICLGRGLPHGAHLAGGLLAWHRAGLPTVAGPPGE